MPVPFSAQEKAYMVQQALKDGLPCLESFTSAFLSEHYMDTEKTNRWLKKFYKYDRYNQTCGFIVGAFVIIGLYSQFLSTDTLIQNDLFNQSISCFLLRLEKEEISTQKSDFTCCKHKNEVKSFSNLPMQKKTLLIILEALNDTLIYSSELINKTQ